MEDSRPNQELIATTTIPVKSSHALELKKVLGVAFGIALVIGNVIGAAILRNPGTIAQYLPNYWLIIACWVFGGIYVLIGVSAYAEMATMLPKAGGGYNYIKITHVSPCKFETGSC